MAHSWDVNLWRRLPMRRFAGIDWASADHAVCVIDESAKVLHRAMVAHTRDGLAELVRALREFGPPADLPVAIERPSGLLVDALVEAGFEVVPVPFAQRKEAGIENVARFLNHGRLKIADALSQSRLGMAG